AAAQALRRSGLLTRPGEILNRRDLLQRAGVVPKYERLLDAILDMLERDGLVSCSGEQLSVTERFALPELHSANLESNRGTLVQRHPLSEPFLDLLYPCSQALPSVLSGTVKATEVLFP